MSYGVKYRITFNDEFPDNTDVWENIADNWDSYTGQFTSKNSWQIDLLKEDYSGSITSLTTGGRKVSGNPLTIQGQSNDDDPLYPILPTEVFIEVFATSLFEFDELFTGDERAFQYKIYLNSALEQIGYITPDGGYDLYSDTPYRTRFRGFCGLSQLKGIPYDNDGTAYSGKQTLLSIILNCLNKLEYEVNLYTAVNFWEATMDANADMLGQVWIDSDTWVRDGETMNCYDVLFNIAYRCNAVVFQREGKWNFIRVAQFYQEIDNVLRTLVTLEPILTLSGEELTILGVDAESFVGYTRYEYDYLGTLQDTTVYKPNVSAGPNENYQLRAINQDHIVMLRQPWRKATIIYDHGEIPNLMIYGDFEPNDFTDSGTYLNLVNWIETGTIAYQGVFQTDVQGSTMGLKITTEIAVQDTYEANFILSSGTVLQWSSGDLLIVRMKYKFEGFALAENANWYFTLKLTNGGTDYFYNGSVWSTTADFTATLTGILNSQLDYEGSFALPTLFTEGTIRMQLHGIFDEGSAASPSVTIDNIEIIHFAQTSGQIERGEIAQTLTTTASILSTISIEGEQELVTGDGRTNFTQGAWLMNSTGTQLPTTWSRESYGETKTLDELNLRTIMNMRDFGCRIIEGTYKGLPRYGDVINHHSFDNKYFMIKRFIFSAKMRKAQLSLHEIKDVDRVELDYDIIIE